MAGSWPLAAPIARYAWLSWLVPALVSAGDFIVTSDIDQYEQLSESTNGFPHQRFRSSPIIAPVFHVNSWDRNLTDDEPYIFLSANYEDVGGGAGPMILDASDLSLVYSDQTWSMSWHCQPQTLHGEKHLTFFAKGRDGGPYVIMDENYRLKHRVKAVHGGNDMHELHLNDEGTAVITTGRALEFDCSRWGGQEKGKILDTGFQELDVETNELLFEWWASDHFDPDDTYARFVADDFGLDHEKKGKFDLSHMNAAQKTEDGNYLISARNFCTIGLVNGTDGEWIWKLGGKKNQFEDLSDGRATSFCWQHNARFYHNQSHITMFDNHRELQGDCTDDCETRGLHLEIDTEAMTARVVRDYYHPGHLNSLAMGGMQLLDSGNAITGWGWTPSYVEFTDDGRVAMDIQRSHVGGGRKENMFAYRIYKGEWNGRPLWPLRLAVEKVPAPSTEVNVFMSWNGATHIAEWRLYASNNADDIVQPGNLVKTSPRDGFETLITVQPWDLSQYIIVAAADKNGDILGQSEAFDVVAEAGVNLSLHRLNYWGAGGAIFGLALTGGVVYAAGRIYKRQRSSRIDMAETKYIPIAAKD